MVTPNRCSISLNCRSCGVKSTTNPVSERRGSRAIGMPSVIQTRFLRPGSSIEAQIFDDLAPGIGPGAHAFIQEVEQNNNGMRRVGAIAVREFVRA